MRPGKPNWLPQEIWEQQDWWKGIPSAREVVLSEGCKRLWEIVAATKAGDIFGTQDQDIFTDKAAIEHATRQVLCTVAYAMEVDIQARSPSRLERRRRASKIANAVQKIEAELDAIAGEGLLPLEIALQLSWIDGLPSKDHAAIDVRFRDLLSRFGAAVDAWANADPEVSHANSSSARQLYLIRRLVATFMGLYHKPMQAQVVSVVVALFPESEIDESTVRKIAPTKRAFGL